MFSYNVVPRVSNAELVQHQNLERTILSLLVLQRLRDFSAALQPPPAQCTPPLPSGHTPCITELAQPQPFKWTSLSFLHSFADLSKLPAVSLDTISVALYRSFSLIILPLSILAIMVVNVAYVGQPPVSPGSSPFQSQHPEIGPAFLNRNISFAGKLVILIHSSTFTLHTLCYHLYYPLHLLNTHISSHTHQFLYCLSSPNQTAAYSSPCQLHTPKQRNQRSPIFYNIIFYTSPNHRYFWQNQNSKTWT